MFRTDSKGFKVLLSNNLKKHINVFQSKETKYFCNQTCKDEYIYSVKNIRKKENKRLTIRPLNELVSHLFRI